MAQAKYLEVAKIITDRIDKGTYQKQQPIPDQETLARELGVSRLTVKKALDGLERQGRVYKQSGLGTFVLGDIPLKEETDFPVDNFLDVKNQPQSENLQNKILHFSVEFPDKEIQKNLNLKRTEPVYNIIRLKVINEQPLMIEHVYMPVKLVPDLDEDILHNSIYGYIHQDLKLKFGRAYRKIRAAKSNDYDPKYLKAAKDDPILELEQIVWLSNGQPIEYSASRNRYDQRTYTISENSRF